ncbi:MAG: hypothetical protein M5U01_19480 [Ardenticatenaceae bacterium]|nr:hypothetical protein [Ardenticatenaceae bacterium]
MVVQMDQSTEAILQRIDTIIQELGELRRLVTQRQAEPAAEDLVEELYGALGQGTWDEYDVTLDWQRFYS